MLERVLKEIRERQRFVVTSHARPDGDGIGSALALGQILRVMGKDADVVMYDGVPRIYQNLPFAGRAIQAKEVPPNDAVILLECDGIRRALLEGLESEESELTRQDFDDIRKEALAQLKRRKKKH